ncbi:MAG: preprotein translocase subunit SecG [Clostridia bacterium]|nr:preprotein translocase subunit SecG [Clostridia bacterium]
MALTNVLAAISPVWTWVLGVILVVLAVFLAIVIAKQAGKEKGLSGTIVGNSDSYFGKNRGGDKDAILARLTIIGSVLLVILVSVLVIIVKNTNYTA